jgi:hypothetical protein
MSKVCWCIFVRNVWHSLTLPLLRYYIGHWNRKVTTSRVILVFLVVLVSKFQCCFLTKTQLVHSSKLLFQNYQIKLAAAKRSVLINITYIRDRQMVREGTNKKTDKLESRNKKNLICQQITQHQKIMVGKLRL